MNTRLNTIVTALAICQTVLNFTHVFHLIINSNPIVESTFSTFGTLTYSIVLVFKNIFRLSKLNLYDSNTSNTDTNIKCIGPNKDRCEAKSTKDLLSYCIIQLLLFLLPLIIFLSLFLFPWHNLAGLLKTF